MPKAPKLSIASRGVKYKLRIALYLMSVLPILVLLYLASNYILPQEGWRLEIILTILVSIIIALSGFFVIKGIFDRILSVSLDAKMIAAGDVSHSIDVSEHDEIGELGGVLNKLTERIRGNMEELKGYSEKTSEINIEIQKRILVLSNLLQVSSLITQGAPLEEIFKHTVARVRSIGNVDIAFILIRDDSFKQFVLKTADGARAEEISRLRVLFDAVLFEVPAHSGKPIILDRENQLNEIVKAAFCEQFKIKNVLAFPIVLKSRTVAVIGIGNSRESFVFKKEERELLDVFAKQLAVALENDILQHKVEKLEIKDALTGLYNESFVMSRLEEEIKRAILYQRPCSFVMLDIDNFRAFGTAFGALQAETTLKKIASLIRQSVTEIDRVARIGDDGFAIVLPEKSKRQALSIAEEMRKKIAFTFSEEQDAIKRLTVSGGVSENPLDGIDAASLIICAKERIALAKKQGKNKIVI